MWSKAPLGYLGDVSRSITIGKRPTIHFDHVETRDVLAGPYRGSDISARPLRTHLIFVDATERDVGIACRQPLDNIVDSYGVDDEARQGLVCPTCPTCARIWHKLPEGSGAQHSENGSDLRANASGYYVWVMGRGDVPLDEPAIGPHPLESAKTTARIAATKGVHDRAVSRGADPLAASFKIVRRYRAGSGESIV